MENKNMIDMRDVSICFGNTVANDHVNFSVKKGEIMAILGENGAGKSTLMKILYGLYTRSNGEIIIDGHIMPRKYSPSSAIRLGVSLVPQHFMLVENFTVAENIILGEEGVVNKLFLNEDKCNLKIEELCNEYGIDIAPHQLVGDLPLGQKQKVEILKALFRNTKVLILDEPTTVLTPQEVDSLFQLLRRLQKGGMTTIIITHKLKEVMSISDRITVMRLGKKRAVFNTVETDVKELTRAMIGKDVSAMYLTSEDTKSTPNYFLKLDRISTKATADNCGLTNLSLSLYPGLIMGVAGIDGNGQRELVEVLAGVTPIIAGQILTANGHIRHNSVSAMHSLGIGVIPEDRHQQGLVLDFNIRDNILMGYLNDPRFIFRGVLRRKKINEHVDRLLKEHDVRPQRRSAVCRFVSGGNQQKIVLCRELERPGLKAVIASQPIRGLDIGAIRFTHETLLDLRKKGKAILLISSDLDEIMSLSDHIAVIVNGAIVASKRAKEFSRDEIGLIMGGAHTEEGTA